MSATTISSVRQPLGIVAPSRLRSLNNAKNVQSASNSINLKGQNLMKKGFSFQIDTENVNPLQAILKSTNSNPISSKSIKATGLFRLKTTLPEPSLPSVASQGTKRKGDAEHEDSNVASKKSATISTRLPLAGRSPVKRPRAGLTSRRRNAGMTRIEPPTTNAPIPFSLDAALAGTIPAMQSKLETKSMTRSNFTIYEDNPIDEAANLMEHSACTLDISDDESRKLFKDDADNKENVSPTTINIVEVSRARSVGTPDGCRTPLANLDTKEFYPLGCDESSVIILSECDGRDAGSTVSASKIEVASMKGNCKTENSEFWESQSAKNENES